MSEEKKPDIYVGRGADVLWDQWGRKWKLVNIKSKGFERQQQPTSEEPWDKGDEIHTGPTTRQSARGSEDGEQNNHAGEAWLNEEIGAGGIRTGAASATASSESSTTRRRRCNTSWNQFQHDHRGRGWTLTQMRQEYYKNKGV